ncbi:hypothetical protein BC830DRAFT_1129479 [Chytriomyces sp. MP71]|nr:hypothetical protein BC830DRAFT_1129479 [Chytriomyces sp. MP71]
MQPILVHLALLLPYSVQASFRYSAKGSKPHRAGAGISGEPGQGHVVLPVHIYPSTVTARMEVRDFFTDKNAMQMSLFLLAFATIEAKEASDPRSFGQIASIHGAPNMVYDSYPGAKPKDGYCLHGSPLFPNWHRPYIGLIENSVYETAQDIAAQYTTNSAQWKAAAKSLRFPHWDWAHIAGYDEPMPAIFTTSQVKVLAPPSAAAKTIANPLKGFKIPNKIYNRNSFNSKGQTTTREQDGFDSDTVDQLRGMLRVLFDGTVQDWQDFSNHAFDKEHSKRAGNYHSLEYIHDQVHGAIGGHMGDPGTAAYDPIFFFHHANVDRLLEIYERIFNGFPDASRAGQGLKPFRKSSSGSWTATDAKSTVSLGYSYSGLDDNNAMTLKSLMLQTYSDQTNSNLRRDHKSTAIKPLMASGLHRIAYEQPDAYDNGTWTMAIYDNGPEEAAYVHFQTHKNALGKPFFVQVYVHGKLAGESYVFAMVDSQEMSVRLAGNVEITDAMEVSGLLYVDHDQWATVWGGALQMRIVDAQRRPCSRDEFEKLELEACVHHVTHHHMDQSYQGEDISEWHEDVVELDISYWA